MPAPVTTLDGKPMTPAERKARQRSRQRRSEAANVEAVDAALVRVFRDQCRYLSSGLARREMTIRELAQVVAHEFPEEERPRVWARLGLAPPA